MNIVVILDLIDSQS